MFGQAGPCDDGHHVPGTLRTRPVHFLQMTGLSQSQRGAGTLFIWVWGTNQAVRDLATRID